MCFSFDLCLYKPSGKVFYFNYLSNNKLQNNEMEHINKYIHYLKTMKKRVVKAETKLQAHSVSVLSPHPYPACLSQTNDCQLGLPSLIWVEGSLYKYFWLHQLLSLPLQKFVSRTSSVTPRSINSTRTVYFYVLIPMRIP